MPSLQTKPFPALIRSLPVEQHAVRVKAAIWERRFEQGGLTDEFAAIFGDHAQISLLREAIRRRRCGRRKCLEILLWGYPTGMRAARHQDYLGNLDKIVERAQAKRTWTDYYGSLHQLQQLGISTISKIAYFHRQVFDGRKALILDSRVMQSVGFWSEFNCLRRLTYQNAHLRYEKYLQVMDEVAGILGGKPDQLEFFLYGMGRAF